MDLGVAGRNYLIFGGTSGMGLAAAQCLVDEGARVAVVGRDADKASSVASSLGPACVAGLTGDLTTSGAGDDLVASAVAALGDLHGIAVTTGLTGHATIEEASDDDWEATFQDVVMGTVRSVRAALPHLVDAGGGTIVTTAAYSIHAYHHNRLPYMTMKTGVVGLTKTIAKAYGNRGVRANCICPGAIETRGLAALRHQIAEAKGVPPEGIIEKMMVDEWHMDVAMGRPGQPEEVGELVAFLLSERAGYLTGAVINIDGGTDF